MVQKLMMNAGQLKTLSDKELLHRLSSLVDRSRRIEAELVAHIAEVDERRLYVNEAFPSMFQYCVDVLHLSEAETYLRISVARAARKHPTLLEMLADGRLHLSGVAMLAKYLTEENLDEVLGKATHKTKRELEELIASLAPKPDVPTSIRKFPEQPPSKPAVEPAATAATEETVEPAREVPPPPKQPPRIEPLAPARYKVQFTADAELKEKLDRLQALRPAVDLAALIDGAVTEKLERIEARKFGKVKNPRTNVVDADTSLGHKELSAAERHFVYERDEGQCTFASEMGRRCPVRHHLEYHHDDPRGLGGDHRPNNVRLVCKQHNLYYAERDYGKAKMEEYRRDHDGSGEAREPLAGFGLFPERVATSPVGARANPIEPPL